MPSAKCVPINTLRGKGNCHKQQFRLARFTHFEQAGNPLLYNRRKRLKTLAPIAIQLNFPSEKIIDRATEIIFQLD